LEITYKFSTSKFVPPDIQVANFYRAV